MTEELTVMIVDSSARAHAVAESYLRSSNVKRVVMTKGNDFAANRNKDKIVLASDASHKDVESVEKAAEKFKPDLIDVCQDDALALGVVDRLKSRGFNVFGPTKGAAQIEWNKGWSRAFMSRHNIPHPEYHAFDNEQEGIEFVKQKYSEKPGVLWYVKATGLCAGKGAYPARSFEEAVNAIKAMKTFKEAGRVYLIEEGMVGEEASIYSISNGKEFSIVKSAQDHKCRDNYDKGPNTGGMGSVAPARVTEGLEDVIKETILSRAIAAMHSEGTPYVGVLYAGIMVTEENGKPVPKVVEFNARWGATEAEAVVPGIMTPMDDIAFSCVEGRMPDIKEDTKTRVCVVGASRGYPDDYSAVMNKRIYGLEEAMRIFGVTVFGAGIKVADNKFYANGGRLFSLVAEGFDIRGAREKAMHAMSLISIEGNNLHYRTDIGWRDVERYNGQR